MTQSFEWSDALPLLEGERIALRTLDERDVSALLAIFGDEEVVQYWSSSAMPDEAAAKALLDRIHEGFRQRELFQWGVALRESNEVIGTCTLYNVDTQHRRAEIGFALRRESWSGGFGSELLRLVIPFAFESLGLHRLEADADPDNTRSLRLLERHGFRREGYLRERWHHLGELRDAVFLGLLRHEYIG